MLRHQVWLFTLSMMTAGGWAANNSVPAALPEPVLSALSQASIPSDAVSVWVARTRAPQTRLISHNAQRPMQAASVIKLVTTYAALDMLGPQFAWRTPVWLDGVIDGEVLKGNLVIQGQGDPSLVLERLWLLLRRVQSMGVRRIDGDVILDGSAFSIQRQDPGAFDGEPLRPYNAAPEALLINFRALTLTFTPDTQTGVARVQMDPPLWGVEVPKAVALTNSPKTACGDYRSALQADFSNPECIGLRGTYDAACGEKIWPVAYAQPETYNARAIEGLWRSMGGDLRGVVRDGTAPKRKPSFVMASPSLGEVIRDINKFSNNVMAQQLFLTLGRWPSPPRGKSLNTQAAQGADTDMPNWPSATFERSRERIREWWGARIGTA